MAEELTQKEISVLDGEKEKNSYESFVSTASNAMSSIRSGKDSLDSLGDKADEANAEEQAQKAAAEGPISVADALALMDAEREAKAKYRKAAAEYLSSAAENFSKIVSKGATVMKSQMDGLVENGAPGATAMGAGLILGSGVIASLVPQSIRSPVMGMMEGYLGLRDNNPTDAEEKFVEGYESEDSAAESILDDNMPDGPGSTAADDIKGKDADIDKQAVEDDTYFDERTDDALSLSEKDKEEIASLDTLFNNIAKKYGVENNDLLKAIGEAAAEFSSGGGVIGAATKVWENLKGATKDEPDDEIDFSNEYN